MKYASVLLFVLTAAGCASTSTGMAPASAADAASESLEPLYGGYGEQTLPDTETVSLGRSCRVGVAVERLSERAAAYGSDDGTVAFDAHGALITVRTTRPGAPLDEVVSATYRHEVNEPSAPFYGYGTGEFVRDDVSATYGFVVRDSAHPETLGTRGFTRLHLDPATGRVVVFTATWPLATHDDAREATLRALASGQTLSCS